jgi:thymidylate synthase ThyX
LQISNFEATGLNRVTAWLEHVGSTSIDEFALRQVLKNINISFVLEEINRVQSTLICELKDSYVQQSQRYVTLSQDSYILPQFNEEDAKQAEELTQRAFELYGQMSQLKEDSFKGRPKAEHYLHGIPIEDARYILPLSAKTNVCVAMSGDKLIEFFHLLNDKNYSSLFGEITKDLSQHLPACLVKHLNNSYNNTILQDNIQNFYSEDFSKINAQQDMILLDKFRDLDMKVGFGALTSTLKETPSQAINKWGVDALAKAEGVTKRVLGYGHDSIAEQARTTFGMMCSMVTYHQQLRHRLSQNYREDLFGLIHDTKREVKVPKSIINSIFYEQYLALVNAFKKFRQQIAKKYGQDKALAFLLNCDQIKLILSTNARIDISMLADRTCMNAQWEIRELAIKKLKILRTLSNVLYEKALPSCVYGNCREGKLTCGQQLQVREKFLAMD